MTVERVVFIRPGETEWNRVGRWQGIVNIPLNAHGINQAKRLAQFVRNIGLDALVASDLRRARDTASILSEYANAPVTYDERLRERDMGVWQGLTTHEIRDWYKKKYEELLEDPHNYKVPNGESRAEVEKRASACFESIVGDSNATTIGIISHTTAIRTILGAFVPDCKPYDMHFRNMSVTTIVRSDDTWRVTQLDDVMHLEGMPSTYIDEVESRAKT
ncbi:MAG: histidine phosphatase family protein [Chloroflexota bacterium]